MYRKLSDAAGGLGAAILRYWARSPHGFQLTVARSVLALSTALVLAANDTSVLLHDPSTPGLRPSNCTGLAALGAFCLDESADAEVVRWLLVLLCVPTLIGAVPGLAAPLHAYAAFTLASNTVGIEGGDYLTASVTAVLALVCVTDWRPFGWPPRSSATPALRHVPSQILLVTLKVQLAYVYLEAAVVKQTHPIWADGSALWFWLQQPNFGARPEIRSVLGSAFSHAPLLQSATWGVIVTEYVLAFSVLAARRRNVRLMTLALSATMHLVFALVLGLVTFAISMIGVVLLVTWRSADAMPWSLYRAVRTTPPRPIRPDRHIERPLLVALRRDRGTSTPPAEG